MATDTVTAYIAVTIIPSDLVARPAAATLIHDAIDPAAVKLIFNLEETDTTWVAALDILAGAVETPGRMFGTADFKAQQLRGIVYVYLASPDGNGTVQFGVDYLRAFVEQAVFNAGDVFEQAERYNEQLDQEWLSLYLDVAEKTGFDPVAYLRDADFDDEAGS